jgi:IclR family transcriptional regulator, pca regulon regulatory protein
MSATTVTRPVEGDPPEPTHPRAPAGDPYFMESLARGLSVIRAFGTGRPRLTGAEVAAITGLSRASARRCLHTLTVLGYATASNGAYGLTPAVLSLAQAYLGTDSLASLAQPILDRLSEDIQEATAVVVLDGDEVVFLARASARRILSVAVSVGSRLPAVWTASGRVLLAYGDAAAAARVLARVRPVRMTPRTLVDRKDLRAELDRVRTQGYAIVDQELEMGLRSMAVPVLGRAGLPVAALNVGVQAGRVDTRTLHRDMLPALEEAARNLAAAMRVRR